MTPRRACWLPALVLLAFVPRPADATHKCIPQTIRCGDSVRTALDATECFIDEESFADFYTFAGPAGQAVTITLESGNFSPSLFLFDPSPALARSQDAAGSSLTIQHTLGASGYWRIGATSAGAGETGIYTLSLTCTTPPLPAGPFLTSPEFPDFRFKVQITGREAAPGKQEKNCVPATVCISGAIPGQPEIFLRLAGPKPNGYLWPTIIKFSTSQVEVWVEQRSTGIVKYYLLPGSKFGESDLPGFYDRTGFLP